MVREATSLFTMANGLDRLERFFSKRKGSAASLVSSAESDVSATLTPGNIPRFPSPSFIRPKAARMSARQEVTLKQASERSPSDPDVRSLDRPSTMHSRKSSEVSRRGRTVIAPKRSLSQLDRLNTSQPTHFQDFNFPKPPSRKGPPSPLSLKPDTALIDRYELPPISPGSRSPLCISIPPARLHTPPASDHEDEIQTFAKKKLPALPGLLPHAPPTPEPSPELRPRHITSESFTHFESQPSEPDVGPAQDHLGPSLLGRRDSEPGLVLPRPDTALSGSTLKEPDFQDFLDLTDDDIADDPGEAPVHNTSNSVAPQIPPATFNVARPQPKAPSLLTLTPPRASRAATAAAFEAARIANRYDFDLIYVVNLWPEGPLAAPKPDGSQSGAQRPMVGRLLAAFGLQNLCSPLQISAAIHTSILKSAGWIEYCNPHARLDELARGYACSFYPGEFATTSQREESAPVSGVKLSERIDRGIVFAAYRRAGKSSRRGEEGLKNTDLGDLHQEAETLVEMLIDIHAMSRLKRTFSGNRLSDGTGPIPVPKVEMV